MSSTSKTASDSSMATNVACIDMGPGTYAIPMSLFRDNRLRVCNALRTIANIGDEKTFILLQGGEAINLYNTDVEYLFRQVRNISHWNHILYMYWHRESAQRVCSL